MLPLQAQAGRVATIVGVGTRGTAKDGDAVETAQINNPYGVIEDANRTGLYWVDNSTHRVLRLDYMTRKLSLVAGTGTAGYSGDGGPAKVGATGPAARDSISIAKAISISWSATIM